MDRRKGDGSGPGEARRVSSRINSVKLGRGAPPQRWPAGQSVISIIRPVFDSLSSTLFSFVRHDRHRSGKTANGG